jgi:hypothetical protein
MRLPVENKAEREPGIEQEVQTTGFGAASTADRGAYQRYQ